MELIFKLDQISEAACKLIEHAADHRVLAFCGQMGAGKTSFIHALCKEMGVKDNVSSPTFSIINQYLAGNGQTVYHLDLFRVADENEAINTGIEDCLNSGNTCMVEWPEKMPAIFPDNTLYITLSVLDTNTRKLQINL